MLALPPPRLRYPPPVPFHIHVYRLSDRAWVHHPPPALVADPDRLFDAYRARELYSNPLGSGHTVAEYWSSPASTLGLPLIAAIYEQGLEVSGGELDVLERELEVLERAWARDIPAPASDSPGADTGRQVPPLHEHLAERARFLREAIHVARESDGFVSIG